MAHPDEMVQNTDDEAYAVSAPRTRMTRHEIAIAILADDVERWEFRLANKGGQQVPWHHELSNAPPSVISYLRRLIRDAGRKGHYAKLEATIDAAAALADAVERYGTADSTPKVNAAAAALTAALAAYREATR